MKAAKIPLVSVIVPIYSVEKYLKRCVDSLLQQSFIDYEIILVDDGSLDNCPVICDEYVEMNNRIFVIHKKNGGLSDARNAGLNFANGKYIYFCDSDDFIHPELLKIVIPYMENGYDMVVFQFYKIDERGNILYSSKMVSCDISLNSISRLDYLINDFLQAKLTWAAWNRVYRRNIIEEHNLRFVDNKKIFAEDLYFCLCYCAYCDRLCLIDKTLYYYLQRRDSIMGKDEFIGNIDRFSLLAEAVFDKWLFDESTEELLTFFPVIYYSILYSELDKVKHYRNFSDKETKDYLFSHINNMDFFVENLSQMEKQIDCLRHLKYDKEFFKKKCEIQYWQSNCYLCYKIKCLMYYMPCDIVSFFKRVSISLRYKLRRVINYLKD